MNFENTEQCCNNPSIFLIEYDLGSLGTKKFKVCNEHMRKKAWNQHIVSQIKID